MTDALPGDIGRPGRDVARLRGVADALGVTPFDLWVAYFAVGGNAAQAAVAAWLTSASVPCDGDYDLLAAAVNDLLRDRGLAAELPYSGDVGSLREPRPPSVG